MTTPSTTKKTVIAVAAAAVLVLVAVGLMAAGQRDGVCPAALPTSPSASEVPKQLILIDAPTNKAGTATRIAKDVVPLVRGSLRRGSRLELVIDRGTKTPLEVDACLDGARVFKITRANPKREQQDSAKALNALERHIAHQIARAPVAPTGSPLRLLQHAHRSSDSAQSSGDLRTLVWSDFISGANDCLKSEGQASAETIAAIVARCVDSHAVRPVGPLTILGAGSSDQATGFEQYGRDLATAVCQQISSDCEVE
jgi:hypothetical protein